MLIIRGPGGFTGGKVFDAMVSHLDIYPTLCELAGVATPDCAAGTSLLPLVRGEVDRLHDEVFTEMTFHAAYEPQRAVRTERWKYIRRFHDYEHPVLANCDDSATKDLLVAAGWGDQIVPEERLYDLLLDPNENREPRRRPESHAAVREELARAARAPGWRRPTTRSSTARSSRRRERSSTAPTRSRRRSRRSRAGPPTASGGAVR